jgi:hypothetical protein
MKKYIYISEKEIPLYSGYFVIILTNSIDNLQKYIPNVKTNNREVYAHSFYENYKGHEGFIVALNFHNNSKIRHGVITHEAYHTANFIASARGLIADFDNDEPVAYLAGWVANEIYDFINKNKLKPI